MAPAMVPAAGAASVEVPYSLWNVLGLSLILVVLCLTGMVMLDVIYNLWSWNQGSLDSAGASIADTFAGMLGMN